MSVIPSSGLGGNQGNGFDRVSAPDQRTTNMMTLIKIWSIAGTMVGGMLAVVVLAFVHDGEYGTLIVQNFPTVIIWCASTLFGMRVTDRITYYLSDRAHVQAVRPVITGPGANASLPPNSPAVVTTTTTSTATAATGTQSETTS